MDSRRKFRSEYVENGSIKIVPEIFFSYSVREKMVLPEFRVIASGFSKVLPSLKAYE